MRYITQLAIILAITFMGELLNYFVPLPVPASIYGLIILFIALLTKLIRLEQIRETGRLLIQIMPVLLIPVAVGLMDTWGELENIILPIAIITIATTLIVMAVSGRMTQFAIRREAKKRERNIM